MNISFEAFVSTIDYSKVKSFSNLDEYNKHNFKDALIESVLYQEFYEICPYDWEKIYQIIDEKGYHNDTSDICDYIQFEIVQQIINNDEDMQEEYTWAKSHQDTEEDYSDMLEDSVTLADSVSEIDVTDMAERQQNSYTGVDTPKTNPNIDKLMLLDQNLVDTYNASNSKDDIELY